MRKTVFGAAAVAVLSAAPAFAAVVNGGFEAVDGSAGLVRGVALDALSGSQWEVYAAIPGWVSTSGYGIEVQRGTVIAPHGGNAYVELDSHPYRGGTGPTNSAMSQNLGALALGVYELTFHYSPRTSDATSMTIDFGVSGGATLADSVGYADGAVGSWTAITRRFEVTGAADVILSFAAKGRADQLGGFIDDVSVSAAPIPLPAAGWLLLAGVAGLGALRRR